jgi:Xaa-Pro aminopeptidase
MRRHISWFAIVTLAFVVPLHAQQGFTRFFPPEEFAARRTLIMDHIGDAVAILQGTTERAGEEPLRQSNQFFYLSGVVEPRAFLIIDGRTRRTSLFLQPYNASRAARNYGPYLGPGEAAARVTGIDLVMVRDSFAAAVARLGADGRTILTPFRAEVLGSESSDDPGNLNRNNQKDPWDGRISREAAFLAHLKEAAPRSEIRNLDPLIDSLRAFKSPREIAVIREATRQAGLGIMEVMRDAKPGMSEYELEAAAEYVYKRGGAWGEAYFPLIADGPRMQLTHYYNDDGKLVDGDLVQFDWAPDYANYTSDVTRVFPANGKFTPRQAEYYTIYLRLYQAVLTSIRPHVTARSIMDSAYVKMGKIMAAYRFTDPKIRAAAQGMMDRYKPVPPGTGRGGGGSLGHSVGMEVHDVRNVTATLEPGYIFTIEPQMTIEGGDLSVRLEDMILITPSGYEVLSGFVPIEIADIEKLMKQPGLGTHALKSPK